MKSILAIKWAKLYIREILGSTTHRYRIRFLQLVWKFKNSFHSKCSIFLLQNCLYKPTSVFCIYMLLLLFFIDHLFLCWVFRQIQFNVVFIAKVNTFAFSSLRSSITISSSWILAAIYLERWQKIWFFVNFRNVLYSSVALHEKNRNIFLTRITAIF